MRRKIIIMTMVFVITTVFVPTQVHAAPRQLNTTLYDGVVKSGYTVYVSGYEGLYKVWLNKNGSVKKSKLLRDAIGRSRFGYRSYYDMKKNGQYIYMLEEIGSTAYNLIRIDTLTGRRKWLATSHDGMIEYAIYKNKIYYCYYTEATSYSYAKRINAVMNLDGSNAKLTTTKVSARRWQSTTKGYYVSIRENRNRKTGNSIFTTYLRTPKGLYKLGSHQPDLY